MLPLSLKGTAVAEEEDDPILLKYKRNRTKVIEQETKADCLLIVWVKDIVRSG